ncbi:condensation domain-containing protein, partial [Niastella populi]|uniref:condensation domain-containing protein n=1 Tax=Niastella populi TaxID=550983 RepID=UPI001F61DD2A
ASMTSEAEVKQAIEQHLAQPFDLAWDYMMRAHLIEQAANSHVLVIVFHHIASDGWSRTIFSNELVALYHNAVGNRVWELSPLAIQYADYAMWQRDHLQGEGLTGKLAYWIKKLKGVEPLQLPLDHARPAMQSFRGAAVRCQIDKELSDRLQALSRREGVTMFMTLLAAFKVLLYRYSGQEDICVGTTIANRTQKETEPLIGFFINTLALRSDLRNNPCFLELLGQVKETTLEAYGHQEVPFEMVVDKVVTGRDMSRNPVFDILFTLHNNPQADAIEVGDITLQYEPLESYTTQFDINFNVTETAAGLQLDIEYCSDLF